MPGLGARGEIMLASERRQSRSQRYTRRSTARDGGLCLRSCRTPGQEVAGGYSRHVPARVAIVGTGQGVPWTFC